MFVLKKYWEHGKGQGRWGLKVKEVCKRQITEGFSIRVLQDVSGLGVQVQLEDNQILRRVHGKVELKENVSGASKQLKACVAICLFCFFRSCNPDYFSGFRYRYDLVPFFKVLICLFQRQSC